MTATFTTAAWSTTVRLVVADHGVLRAASADLADLLHRVDAAASRFRADSALTHANEHAGHPVAAPKLLVELVDVALDAAARTDGAVDPTLGTALAQLGYDRDIAAVRDTTVAGRAVTSRGRWRAVRVHREFGLLTVPPGTALDLGATAKAWTADRAARTLASRYRTGVLVELGGDLAVAGPRPDGWTVRVAERAGQSGQLVHLTRGGLATSTTTLRRWRRHDATGTHDAHHIVDPATGASATGPWRTVSVAAGSALDANVASTAAIIKGADAVDWLSARGLAARLVDRAGTVHTTAGWPVATDLPVAS